MRVKHVAKLNGLRYGLAQRTGSVVRTRNGYLAKRFE